MKLARNRDLAPIRAAAKDKIDAAFQRRAGETIPTIYAAKVAAANAFLASGTQFPALVAEAQRRGLTLEALAHEILDRAAASHARALDVEADRQRLLGELAAATSEQAIAALVAGL